MRKTANPYAMTRRVLWLAIAVAIVTLAWIGYWVAASAMVRKEVEARLAAGIAGVRLDCDAVMWGGFPFRFERDCSAPRLAIAGTTVSAARFIGVLQAWNYSHAMALIDGPSDIDVRSEGVRLTLVHDRALASLRRLGDGAWQGSLELPNLTAAPLGRADRLLLHARSRQSGEVDVALDGEGVVLANAVPSGSLRLDNMRLAVTLPRAAIRQGWAAYLAQSGDTIAVETVELGKGPLTLTGTGKIGVDSAGHIAGTLLTKCNRLDLLISALQTDFGVKANDAQALGAMIGLLNDGRTDGAAELNLIAKDGKLYWGPVKLATLPALF